MNERNRLYNDMCHIVDGSSVEDVLADLQMQINKLSSRVYELEREVGIPGE